MKKLFLIKAALFLALSITSLAAIAQTNYTSKETDIRLTGTSTLHDWEMIAVKATSEASLVIDVNGIVTSLTKLTFILPAKSLKSNHTIMDKTLTKP